MSTPDDEARTWDDWDGKTWDEVDGSAMTPENVNKQIIDKKNNNKEQSA